MKGSITLERLAELMRQGCERATQDEARHMGYHPNNEREREKAFEYFRGKRHGMDDLLMAAERAVRKGKGR
jgi:hypothetical protein